MKGKIFSSLEFLLRYKYTMITPIIFLAGWEILTSYFKVPFYILPPLSEIFKELLNPSLHWPIHIKATLYEVLLGFILAVVLGIFLAIIIEWSDALRQMILPWLVFINTLPKVAVAPLFLVWFGYGTLPTTLLTFLICFFPITINTATGLERVDPELIDLLRSLRATKSQIFVKIRLPNSLPMIISGLKVSSTMAVIGAIIGEFIASSEGLGYLIVTAQISVSTDVIFAAIIYISVMGLCFFGIVVVIEKILSYMHKI